MNEMQLFYDGLVKPSFAPPADVFGPVWAGLYVLIIIAGVIIFLQAIRGRLSPVVFGIYIANLIANITFTSVLLSFGLAVGFVHILIVLLTLIYLQFRLIDTNLLAFSLLLPYGFWVGFATVLQLSLLVLN